VATLVLVNTLELESISTAGSIGFLLVFAVVNLVGVRKAAELKSSKWIAGTGAFLCLAALAALLVHNFQTSKMNLLIAGGVIAVCFVSEYLYKRREN
jgi:cytosine/uracil/thiamine/allantoin permease